MRFTSKLLAVIVVGAMSASANAAELYMGIGGQASAIQVYDPSSHAQVGSLGGLQDAQSLAFGQDGYLYVGGTSGQVQVWDTSAQTMVDSFGPTSVQALAFDANGLLYLGIGGQASAIQVFDPNTHAQVGSLGGLQDAQSLAFGRDGYLYVGGTSGQVQVWDTSAQTMVDSFGPISVQAMAFGPVSSVPEPEVFALMLAGLVIVAWRGSCRMATVRCTAA